MNLTLAETLAKHLMKKWDVDPKWKFVWSNGKTQLGCIRQTKQSAIDRGTPARYELRLSRHLVRNNSEDEVRDTILHEIAHIKAGHEAGHGPLWKEWAIKVGAKPNRCADSSVKMPEPKYIVVCTVCEKPTRKAHKRIRLGRKYCKRCGMQSVGKLEMQLNPESGQVK